MAQDFQDLTGQVIKKLVDTTQNLESDLLGLLVEFGPADRHPEAGSTNGPAVDPIRRNDVVNGQQQVDDLLDSLGF
jgi:chemotaxis protein CheZ